MQPLGMKALHLEHIFVTKQLITLKKITVYVTFVLFTAIFFKCKICHVFGKITVSTTIIMSSLLLSLIK